MNKQSLITILLTVLISIVTTKAFAQDIEVANADGVTIYYKWINDNKELAVTYLGSSCSAYPNRYSGNLMIPESVVYEGNTYNVTSIGSYAFGKCSALTSVTIPNCVTSIGNGAFERCSGLTSIEIPNSVTFIGGSAFADCSSLSSVTIPNSVTSIDGGAFGNCWALSDFYCWANNVPSTSIHAFEMTPCNKATLHVPVGSVDAYKKTNPWSSFGTIVALTDDDPNPAALQSLYIENNLYSTAKYTIDGKRISKPIRGLNIIRMSDGTTKKVLVK